MDTASETEGESSTGMSGGPTGQDTTGNTTDATVDPSDPTTTDVTTTGVPTTSDTADTSDTGQTGCSDNSDCGGATPFCSAGTCVSCSDLPDPDLACTTESPDTPLCIDQVGCVQCTEARNETCSGTTPICDTALFECVPCTYHDQCTTACNLDTGECMPDDPAVWVRPEAVNCSPTAAGNFDLPFCTLTQAVDVIVNDNDGIGTIWLDDSVEPHEGVSIPSGATIAIIGPDPAVRPQIDPGSARALDVTEPGARLYVENVLVGGGIYEVIVIDGESSVWLDRTEVVGNLGQAIDIRSGAVVHLRNTIVASNGRNSNIRAPIYVSDAEVHAVYTTVADNGSSSVDSIECVGTNTVEVRNSIVVARDAASIDCGDISVDHSFIDTTGLGGNGNTVQPLIAGDLATWFVAPGNFPPPPYEGQDYHLSAAGAALFEGIGLVAPGDPPFDIDLDPRPDAGVATMPGADVP